MLSASQETRPCAQTRPVKDAASGYARDSAIRSTLDLFVAREILERAGKVRGRLGAVIVDDADRTPALWIANDLLRPRHMMRQRNQRLFGGALLSG